MDPWDGGLLSRPGRNCYGSDKTATMVDVGGYYKFRDPGFQLLYCYGHTVIGQRENYTYLGLYWTWGNKSGADVTMNNLMSLHLKG
jgi:hypothetical protein